MSLAVELGQRALSLDADGCTSEPVPRAVAEELCAALAFLGVSAALAPDGDDDSESCFVIVGSEPGIV